ncbi:hypothetical protein CJD29_16345, partial [Bacillus licheniformis]
STSLIFVDLNLTHYLSFYNKNILKLMILLLLWTDLLIFRQDGVTCGNKADTSAEYTHILQTSTDSAYMQIKALNMLSAY